MSSCLSNNNKISLTCNLVDWRAYHNKECNAHDCCGAIQGCGGGEDLQHLFDAVDASLDAPHTPVDPHAGTEAIDSTHPGDVAAPTVAKSVCVDEVRIACSQYCL